MATNPVTVAQLRQRVREMADQVNSTFISDDELTRYIDQSYRELYDELVGAWGDDYFTKPDYVLMHITASVPTYDLPADCKALKGVDVFIGGGTSPDISGSIGWTTCPRRSERSRNLGPAYGFYGTLYGPTLVLGYRPCGFNTIQFLPTPLLDATVRLRYVPLPTALTGSGDTIDGFNGWEELVVVDAAIKCLNKEQQDVSVLAGRKADMLRRIRAMAPRDAEGIDTVQETRPGWHPFPFRGWR